MQLAGVLSALAGDALRTASAQVRREIAESLEGKGTMEMLQAVHNALLERRLLDTPSEAETKVWKRLVVVGQTRERVAIALPASQSASLRGRPNLAVFGARTTVQYRVP